jgi:putative hemolysin
MSAPASTSIPVLPWDAVIAITAVCLVASGFFSGSETGLMSTSRVRLRRLTRGGSGTRNAQVMQLLERLEESILGCLIGTNLFNVLGSAVMTVALTARFGDRGEWGAALLMSVLIILFAEILPKILFREYPERLVLAAAPLLRAGMMIMSPLLWLLRGYAHLWERMLPEDLQDDSGTLDRRRLTTLLLAHTPSSRQDRDFRAFMRSFLELAALDVRRIMRPFAQVVSVSRTATAAECVEVARRSGFSRLPVVDEPSVRPVGWISARDLLLQPQGDPEADHPLPQALVRTCLFVDAGMTPYELFEELHGQGESMAIVVDREGHALGLVTLEDLVETVVGSIQDEFERTLPGETRVHATL